MIARLGLAPGFKAARRERCGMRAGEIPRPASGPRAARAAPSAANG
jgi:hypothetical protein